MQIRPSEGELMSIASLIQSWRIPAPRSMPSSSPFGRSRKGRRLMPSVEPERPSASASSVRGSGTGRVTVTRRSRDSRPTPPRPPLFPHTPKHPPISPQTTPDDARDQFELRLGNAARLDADVLADLRADPEPDGETLARELTEAGAGGAARPASAPGLLVLSEPINWIRNGCDLRADIRQPSSPM